MYHIEYNRFLIQKDTIKQDSVNYTMEFDHSETLNDTEVYLPRLLKIVHQWLKNHFGAVRIYHDDQFIVRICNHKLLKKVFIKQHIRIHLK